MWSGVPGALPTAGKHSASTVGAGGFEIVSGTSARAVGVLVSGAGASQVVYGGGLVSGGLIEAFGGLSVGIGATASANTIQSGGVEYVSASTGSGRHDR